MTENTVYLSIDYGTHKSGLAYSVEGFCFAHTTLSTRELLEYLPKWIQERKPKGIIIGMPYNIDGTESAHCKKVRMFAKTVKKAIPIEIIFHDERLTTSEAKFGGVEDIDAESARLILVDYIKNI